MVVETKKINILYIDDEEANLKSFKMAFKRDFVIYTAISAEKAFEILKEVKEIPLIISDQKMPEMTGIEFFSKIITVHPETIRILLTGYTETLDLINAINEGNVYRYIVKPWNASELKQTIAGAIAHYQLKKKNIELIEKLKNTNIKLEEAFQELKATQDKLIANEKMSILGKLTADLVHEMNNQMGGFSLLEHIEISPKDKSTLELILKSKEHMLSLLKEINSFSRNEKPEYIKELFSVEDIIQTAVNIAKLNSKIKFLTITIENKIERKIIVSKNKLIQVLINLIKNSADAMDDVNDQKNEIIISTKEKDNSLIVQISDNGVGMNSETVNQIWKPFFTTKANEKESGTGIGLEISKRIIEGHNGTIECKSELNKGSIFTITLPFD